MQTVSSQPSTHAGLWLDKYLEHQPEGGGEGPRAGHFDEAAKRPVPPGYPILFGRWKSALERAGVTTRPARAQGRIAVGLGGESVLETSITLHRIYGVPFIPGSALKGLAARYARTRLVETWATGKGAYEVMFGDPSEAGYVTFFDALYIPESASQDRPLAPDVITVHHPEYYRGEASPPADWDNPTPIPFLSATGDYLIPLHGAEDWVEAAFEILSRALAEEGIGAKTSSGYGRMVILGTHTDPVGEDADQPTVDRFEQLLEQMPIPSVAGEIHHVYEQWKEAEVSDTGRLRIAQAILEKIAAAGRTKKSAKKKWFKELQAFVAPRPRDEEN